jgi:hypothetical protein
MFKDSYKDVSVKNLKIILDIVNDILPSSPLDSLKTKALSHGLPFYEGYQIVETRNSQDNPAPKIHVITPADLKNIDAQHIHILNGTNAPIYALNKNAPISLSADNVVLYTQFFFEYVRGAQGKFQVINALDDVEWIEEPAMSGRKALEKMINPITIINDHQDGYDLKANIIFKNSLFESDIEVKQDGQITLKNQKILVEDLPIEDQLIV